VSDVTPPVPAPGVPGMSDPALASPAPDNRLALPAIGIGGPEPRLLRPQDHRPPGGLADRCGQGRSSVAAQEVGPRGG
jgi:hypothetical protein